MHSLVGGLVVFLVFLFLLMIPVMIASGHKDSRSISVQLFFSLSVVLIPLALFFGNLLTLPWWKGDAHCGWVNGFSEGELALAPIVLFATAALYRREAISLPAGEVPPTWVALGIYSGALTSIPLLMFGIGCLQVFQKPILLLLVCYAPVWYFFRTFQLLRAAILPALHYLWTTVAIVPFWIGSWIWSHSAFDGLPDQPPSCFIVTAASRGHANLVGPFITTEHDGHRRLANRQLHNFWQFEALWMQHSPRTHRAFRKLYNRIGPRLALHITTPWRADLVFLVLKPAEYLLMAVSVVIHISTAAQSRLRRLA